MPGLRLSSVSRPETVSPLDTEHNSVIMREHQKIFGYIHDLKFCAAHSRKGHMSEMVRLATKFGSSITLMVEEMLSSKVASIVSSISGDTSSLDQSLVSITSLGLEGNHLCRLMTKHGAVSSLVNILSTDNKEVNLSRKEKSHLEVNLLTKEERHKEVNLSKKEKSHLKVNLSTKEESHKEVKLPSKEKSEVRGQCLRALATLCSVLEAIRQLEEVRGVEVIARLLSDLSIDESERAEAAGVLAQVTSPWIEDNDYVLGVTENAFNLVKNLTHLCSHTRCDETFLLGSAALANLSFLSPLILTAMTQHNTVSILLQYLSHNVSPSIYIQVIIIQDFKYFEGNCHLLQNIKTIFLPQDQVATVIANMAARHDTQESLISCNIVNILLYLLAANPSSDDLPVLAATQRVQQKAAIAIGR